MDIVTLTEEQKPAALAALYNASQPLGLGILHYTPEDMTETEAENLLKKTKHFDYLKGRVMKVSFDKDQIDLRLYDRDNGSGRGATVLRAAGIIS